MKKLTAMLFTLLVAVAMTMPAFAAGQQTQDETAPAQSQTTPKKQKKHKNGDNKVRVAEIHLWRIAKLDRAEKRDADSPAPELSGESQDAPL